MSSGESATQQLQERLKKLEFELRNMLESTNNDLQLARMLQTQLMPNRLPNIIGLQTQARYISARELSSESYDLIPANNNRELWMIHSWTSNFGLSAVLLQTLLHLKSTEILKNGHTPEVHVVFDQITEALCMAQKKGSYRLMVAKLDLNTLTLSGTSIGQAPFLIRKFEKGILSEYVFVEPDMILKNPSLMERALSSDPLSALKANRFDYLVSPGSRLFLVGREWNSEAKLDTLAKPLELQTLFDTDKTDTLLSNINNLAIKIEDHIKNNTKKSDITIIGFEVNSKLLHLA